MVMVTLIKDNDGIMDLPKGFPYKIIGKAGELMNDGCSS